MNKCFEGLTFISIVQPTCCANAGIFTLNQGQSCRITKSIDEQSAFLVVYAPFQWKLSFPDSNWNLAQTPGKQSCSTGRQDGYRLP
jgi:hypothetical protein